MEVQGHHKSTRQERPRDRAALERQLEVLAEELSATKHQHELDLRQAETELSNARAAVGEAETKLDERFREVAAMTMLLREEEEARRADAEKIEWLQQVTGVLLAVPAGWPLISARVRAKQQRRVLKEKGLFDCDAYLAQNPDVAAAGVDPLSHYLLNGIIEGRSRAPAQPDRSHPK
jgi:hypothetical protein